MNPVVTGKKKVYKRPPYIAAITPLDLALLDILPDEGQMLGYQTLALQVDSIKRRKGFEGLSGNQIAGRFKSMSYQGLVVSQVVFPIQGGLGWQRTAKGRALLEKNGKVVTKV